MRSGFASAGTVLAVLMVLHQAGTAAGCSLLCGDGCRFGRKLTWHRRTSLQCDMAGTVLEAKVPPGAPPTTSCDYLIPRAVKGGPCDLEWSTEGRTWEASCQAAGECLIDWPILTDTCLCTPRPPGPCDGKCQALPLCGKEEELSTAPCTAEETKEGTCREDEVCCVASVCRKRQVVPVPAPSCRTQCGRRVASGETVQGDGTDHCNTCTCEKGGLSCTEKACPAQDPVCLVRGRACHIQAWGWKVMDRSHECPRLTRCTEGQKYRGFRFSFCDPKPRLCHQVVCVRAPCPCLETDRIINGATITLDTELFTLEQTPKRWTIRLVKEAEGMIVKLWFGSKEDVPAELVVLGWTSERLEGAQVEGFEGDVLAHSPVIDAVGQALMISLTRGAVKVLSQGGTLTLIDFFRL